MSKITENPKALEMLRSIFVKAGEHAHVNEISEALAHACVQAGQLEKAASIYQELAQLEPENPLHVQNYKQIQAKLGKAVEVREMSKEEGAQALMVDELERPVPTLQQSYPDHIRDLVKAAVTEAELFESYNMAVKAIAPLEKALPEAPNDATINQRLASLYARTGRLQEAIERCQVLQKVYTEAGLAEQAAQYRDMAQKYAERADAAKKVAAVEYDASFMPGHEIGAPPHASAAAASPQAPSSEPAMSAPAMQEFSIDVTPPEPAAAPPAAPAPAAQHAHEIDLSDWEQMTQVEKPGEPLVDAAEVAEEAMFYIAQSLWNEAEDTIGKLRKMAPDSPAIADLQQKLGAAKAQASSVPAAASQQASVAEFTFEPEAPAPPPPVAAEPAAVEPPRPAAPPPPPPAPPKSQPAVAAAAAQPAPAAKGKDVLADFALDLDESLGADFAVSAAPAKSAPAPPPPAPAPVARATAPAAVAPAPAQKPAAPPAPVAPIAAHPDASSTLSDLFEEFKEGVEETADQAEDPDTHYNLGVAFKEMGLLDEAIGELQKVCHAIDKGHPFSQVMQAYTWLAHCFLEKGSPEASVKWYEKALKVPSIDEESKLAVYYELGAAYEAAGNKKAALQNFNEVYSSNIDYRDVADRIKALRS
jgi:tetratricopeptide (TPR) repeat protein